MRAVLLSVLLLAGCASEPERPVQKVERNIVFRLGARPEGVEVRLESSFYPTSGYELVARVEGAIPAGVTIVLEGVRAPLEAKGAPAPAAAIVNLPPPEKGVDGVAWPLLVRVSGEAERTDAYTVTHTAAGWKVSPGQGSFSRFEAQGSY